MITVVVQSMEPREVLKMSLLFPDLFTEGMWRSLAPLWDQYAFLSLPPRKRYVEIAYRTCSITGYYVRHRRGEGNSFSRITCTSNYYSVRQQALFAIYNQRKDILEKLVSTNATEMYNLYHESTEEDKIHFNRPMFNYLASLLDIELTEKQKFIMDGKLQVDSSSEQVADFVQISLINDPSRFYSAWLRENVLEPEEDGKSKFIKELSSQEGIAFWFMVYSRSQEKEMLERFVELTQEDDLTAEQKYVTLRSLFTSNHLQLAARFGRKFNLGMHVTTILSCLATYYFNTGDDRGLYQSLSHMEKSGVLQAGPCVSDIFRVELPEVVSLLSRNYITETSNPVHIINSLFSSQLPIFYSDT
ncbi:Hypothetical protein BRZCDTV_487 [Brazilian cedratvirus IHUMI]|uniref:Uncharacterized protein n=1 Tax=Brazilian cedratvirus IHUMI TaxID=2126980 RepID=A0A2R8FFD1_9VIRU|nr:Hypothetical protein BRZCDTV_487 [Brazilian cedratvirus IHUMI]